MQTLEMAPFCLFPLSLGALALGRLEECRQAKAEVVNELEEACQLYDRQLKRIQRQLHAERQEPKELIQEDRSRLLKELHILKAAGATHRPC